MPTFADELTSQLQPLKENAVRLHGLQSENLLPLPQSSDDIHMAVRDIVDMSEKVAINFVMLGALARAIRDKSEVVEGKLEFGFPKSNLTPEVKSLFKTWGFEETKYGYRYDFVPPLKWDTKIPVEIHVIKGHYSFFDHLDRGFFGVDNFYIPNPFENYWKVRHLIK